MKKINDKKTDNKIEVKLQPLNIKTIKVKLIGKTPLMMGKMGEETKTAILEKQTGVAKSNKKKVRDTKKEVEESIHKTSKGKIGFPVAGFKLGMMDATARVGDKFFSKRLISGGIRIINSEEGLIPIDFGKREVLEHTVKGQTLFNPIFYDWNCELVIQFDGNNISPSDIVTLLNYAGFYVGVGMWRPKCRDGGSGEYGSYEVKLN